MYRNRSAFRIATLHRWRHSHQQSLRLGYFRSNVKEWTDELANLSGGTCEGGRILPSRSCNLPRPSGADSHEIQQRYEHARTAISHVRMCTFRSAERFLVELDRFTLPHNDGSRFPKFRSFYFRRRCETWYASDRQVKCGTEPPMSLN